MTFTRRCLVSLVLLLSFVWAGSLSADQETLQVSATSTPDDWVNVGGANKVASVTAPDDDDTSYIHSTTSNGTQQQFALTNTSGAIEADATISFVQLRARCRRGGSQNVNFRMTIVLGAGTTDGGNQTGTASYTDFTDQFSTRPTGGSWTKADVDALEIRIRNTQGRQLNCTTYEVIVDYTNQTTATDLLLAHWNLNELPGVTTAADASGQGHTGTLCEAGTCPSAGFNGWTSAGKILGALLFDGVDDYVEVAHHADLNTVKTIAVWFNKDNLTFSVNQPLLTKGDFTDNHYSLVMGGFDDASAQLWCNIGNNYAFFEDSLGYSLSNFTTGVWYHIVCTANASGHELFVNGTSVATNTVAPATVTTTLVLRIGESSAFSPPTNHFAGRLDDIRLYNYRLPVEEVQALHALGAATRRRGTPLGPW